MRFFDPLSPDEDAFAELRERAASTDPITAAKCRMLLELVEYLQSRGPTPVAGVMLWENELWISLSHPARNVTVMVDWPDRSATRDGLPTMHYRLKTQKPGQALSEDARVTTGVEAAYLILTA